MRMRSVSERPDFGPPGRRAYRAPSGTLDNRKREPAARRDGSERVPVVCRSKQPDRLAGEKAFVVPRPSWFSQAAPSALDPCRPGRTRRVSSRRPLGQPPPPQLGELLRCVDGDLRERQGNKPNRGPLLCIQALVARHVLL